MIKAVGRLAAAGLAVCAAGCAVGPNFKQPQPPAADRYTPAALPATTAGPLPQQFSLGAPVDGRWWTLFGSPELNAFEDEALKANPDLAAAEAALRAARETYFSQRATLWPSVTLTGSAARAKNTAVLASPLADNSDLYTLYQGQLNLAYAIDAFGGVRRQIESAEAQAQAQRFETEAAYLSLTANVAAAALQIAGLDDQLDGARRAIAADRRTLDLTRQEQALGQASALDVAAARSALELAQAAAPPLVKQIDLERDLLADLLGRPGEAAPQAAPRLASLTLPQALPVSLPADLVRQRPDVRAAEANLHAASAEVGVAIAARLPSLTLTADVGGASTRLATLLAGGNGLWSVSGDLAQTVFDAGALQHKQQAAEAALDQAKAQYRSAVLAALQNTADVLQSILADAEADRHAAAAEEAAETSLALAQDEFKAGETGMLPVLAAEGALAQADQTMAQSRAARYADAVALFQALGGGWWNDKPEDHSGAP